MATVAAGIGNPISEKKQRSSFAYWALLVFSFLYYARPEDVIPGLNVISVAKIAGGLAVVGLIAGLMTQKGKVKFPLEVKLLLLLGAQMCLTIPFAYWRGGAFATVFGKYSKGVIVAILVSMLVTNLPQLRKLLWVQAAAMVVTAIASILLHRTVQGRLSGALGGIFENPNDLAINIALNWSLCLAFLLRARGPLKKAVWGFGILAMLYAVVATYSRSGFLALVLAGLLCVWEFGVKGRRFHLVLLAGIFAVLVLAFAPPQYYQRLQSIVFGSVQGDLDRGSAEAGKELLRLSVHLMITHPLVGIGPGNFPAVTGTWRVAHNTYSELGAEAGIPALLLFLLVMASVYRNLRVVQKTARFKKDPEFRLFAGALVASFGAYLMGAFFSDTAYELFPYFLVAYTVALRRIAISSSEKSIPQSTNRLKVSQPIEGAYARV